jgi:hypothetical protein
MTSISALIDFLMSLMKDEDTKREFDKNPEATMADHGLRDVSAQDVRDARLIMADEGSARPREDGGDYQPSGQHEGGLSAGGNGAGSAVREIVHTTNTFEIDQSRLSINIDNSRTNILDSFNSQDTVTAIQDNDTVNNDVDVINVEDSFNEGDKPEETEEKPEEPGEVSVQPVESVEPVETAQPFDIGEPVADPGGEVRVQPVDESDEPGEDAPPEPEPVPEESAELYPADEPVDAPADDLPVA